MASLSTEVNKVKIENNWKSQSRIVGRAAELFCCVNFTCPRCNSCEWLECVINEKSKDQVCNSCKHNFQIKCKGLKNKKEYDTIVNSGQFKTIGAEYSTTIKSLENCIDYIIILYDKTDHSIYNIMYVKYEDITEQNIIARKPLSSTAKRSGWQGCILHFTSISLLF